jgi:hypothetical protein
MEKIADLLVNFQVEIRSETGALAALLDARSEWSRKRLEFREKILNRVARTLQLKAPKLAREAAADMAVILVNNMKMMVAMTLDNSAAASPGSPAELRLMNRLYLVSKLAGLEEF